MVFSYEFGTVYYYNVYLTPFVALSVVGIEELTAAFYVENVTSTCLT
jgi:hypothetical protein